MSNKPLNVLILSNVAALTRTAGIKVMDALSVSHQVTQKASQEFLTYGNVAVGVHNALYGIKPNREDPNPEPKKEGESKDAQ